MNIIFRADSSVQIGTGHLMRCLTLADELRERGAKVSFICRELSGNQCNFVENKGYQVYRLPCPAAQSKHQNQKTSHSQWLGVNRETDAEQTKAILMKQEQNIEWLIVDQYGLDKQWEMQMRPYVKKIMVIDDLADRPHDCDLLLDQNYYVNPETRYAALVPRHCRQFLGPRYALLRSEFRKARKNLRERNGNVQRILIFFGGSDPTNETVKALQAIRVLNRADIAVDVVVGAANPNKNQVKEICSLLPNVNYYCQINNMAELMARADLAVGAGGAATWERCVLGLPAITVIVAQNQYQTTVAVAAAGAIWNMGFYDNVSVQKLADAFAVAMDNSGILKDMGEKAMQLMGGKLLEGEGTVLRAIIGGSNATA